MEGFKKGQYNQSRKTGNLYTYMYINWVEGGRGGSDPHTPYRTDPHVMSVRILEGTEA